ncbi:hypothetical protein GCM10023194_42240 [Planotetraspora phitsanulokensis]|uniref:Uncharacterized protein n=1 Tax=Planotetraspora phitsanulokensis TaxID=575192 RepID=A0A8J3U6B7_9ACTN|nr:hypothetical protein Pph01_28300 [Planotetraspora phitsanulokensis]
MPGTIKNHRSTTCKVTNWITLNDGHPGPLGCPDKFTIEVSERVRTPGANFAWLAGDCSRSRRGMPAAQGSQVTG